MLNCPSDPSPNRVGFVQTWETPPWGSTNYLANWWAFGGGPNLDYFVGYGRMNSRMVDGPSITVLFAEGYSECDGIGRKALLSYDHYFGFTQPVTLKEANGAATYYPRGWANTTMFQLHPDIRPVSSCPLGTECCNNWTVQAAHDTLNAAMGDGSVRGFTKRMSPVTWGRLMMPNDRQAVNPGDLD